MTQAQQPEALRLADALAYCDSSVAAQAARELRAQHARIAELEQHQAALAAVPLPLLVRDIARDLGITVPQACIALKPLGNYSTNSAVTAEMARMLRDHFPDPAPMPVAHPHHCTARTADGTCEECEGHAQAMAEWNAERAALAATTAAGVPAAAPDARDAESRTLVEILAANWAVWPAGNAVEQTCLGNVFCSTKGRNLMFGTHQIAVDQDKAVVTRDQWCAARAAIAAQAGKGAAQ